MVEETKETEDSKSNLKKLRSLVNELEKHEMYSSKYGGILKEIESAIKDERKIICKLKRSDSKIKHYESICENILTIIGASSPMI